MGSFFSNIPIPTFRIDLTGKILEANRKFYELLSIPEDKSIDEFYISQFITGKEGSQSWIARLLKNTPEEIMELSCNNYNGDNFWVDSHTYVEMNDSGKPFAICGIWVDITSKKLASHETRRLLEVIKQAPISLVLTDLKGRIYYVNSHFTKVSGYGSHEALGKSPGFLKSGFHSFEFYEELWTTIVSRKIWNGIFVNKRKDGSIFYEDATVFPLFNNDGKPAGYAAIKLDISEQYRIQQELLKTGETLKSIFENISEGIVRLSIDGTIEMINSALIEELGLDPDKDYPGENISELLPGHPINFQGIIDTLAIEEEIKYLVIESHPNYYRINGKILKQENQNPLFIISVENISDEKILEKQLIEAQKTEALGQIAEGITHELNNILTNISASLFQLKNTDNVPEEIIKVIESSVQRGKNLAERLFIFVKPDKPSIQPLNAEEIFTELSFLVNNFLPKNIHLRYSRPDSSVSVGADKNQLSLLFLNLVLNAADAMPDGGIIDIDCTTELPSKISRAFPDTESGSDYCVFIVKDTGVGIEKAALEKVFDPFYTKKPRGKGTGLGLNVARKIAEIHGGTIAIESHPGFGTTVFVVLPLIKTKTVKGKNEPLPVNPFIKADLSGKRLLIIEDEEDLRNLLGVILRKASIKSDFYANGKEGLAAYEANLQEYDLVVTDLGLPDFSGALVIEKILKINPSQKVIAMTGYVSNDMLDKLERLEIGKILKKPFTIPQFFEIMGKKLG